MNRTYELVFIADPRLTDEQVVALADDYKAMIKTAGGNVVREESWGKRKLAYPIAELSEGQYAILSSRYPAGRTPSPRWSSGCGRTRRSCATSRCARTST